jgi:hypothetical protein
MSYLFTLCLYFRDITYCDYGARSFGIFSCVFIESFSCSRNGFVKNVPIPPNRFVCYFLSKYSSSFRSLPASTQALTQSLRTTLILALKRESASNTLSQFSSVTMWVNSSRGSSSVFTSPPSVIIQLRRVCSFSLLSRA